MKFDLDQLWALLNRRWRPVEMDELKRMPIDLLETVIASAGWEQKDVDKIWQKKHGAFEVH